MARRQQSLATAPIPRPNGDNLNKEIVQQSVTKDDHLVNIRRDGTGSVFYFQIPPSGIGGAGIFSGNSYLPYYWSHQRDRVLRATVHFEGMWADVVGMWLSKIASQSWEIKGVRVQRLQHMLLNGWGEYIYKLGRDFLTTDNGCFFEIVRASSAAGSRVLGTVQLDSIRCTRTGDPDYPVIYQDLMGRLHALRAHEVCSIVDMPSPADTYYGVGLCAASRSFDAIVTMASIEQLVQEKTSGSEPTAISFVNASVNETQLADSIKATKEQRLAKGYLRYMGVVLIPLVNLDANPTIATIPLKSLPEGFKSEEERENAQRKYALATGQDMQVVNPRLIGSGSRGTSAQSNVLREEQQGFLPSYFRKELTHLLNESVLPNAATFYFGVKDLAEELKQAQIRKTNAETRKLQIESGEIDANIARQIAVEMNELSPRFIEGEQVGQPLSDADKAGEVKVELEQPVKRIESQQDPNLGSKSPETKEVVEARARLAIQRALGTDEVSLATKKQWEETLKQQDKDYAALLVEQERENAATLYRELNTESFSTN